MARSPIHPGEHLAEQLEELDMSAADLSHQLEVPTNRITAILGRVYEYYIAADQLAEAGLAPSSLPRETISV